MKTNRILYPNGSKVSAADYASTLNIGQFHFVPVRGREYFVHRYEGRSNKIPQAVVLLSYTKTAFGQKKTLSVFLCSNMTLSDEKILELYTHRWSIEVMFSFLLTDEKNPLRLCHNCQRAFLAARKDSLFCSPKC